MKNPIENWVVTSDYWSLHTIVIAVPVSAFSNVNSLATCFYDFFCSNCSLFWPWLEKEHLVIYVLRPASRGVMLMRARARWHPKFTFSTFTPDPNLQNPHLHKTQIYTNSNLHSSDLHTPKFTQPNIGIPKFTQLKFTQN